MTMRTRFTIDPSDIVAIEYECRQCHSHYSVAVERITKIQTTCPDCGVMWIMGEPDGSYEGDTTITNFVRSLYGLESIAPEAFIRLEIKSPPSPVRGRMG